jgi:hypothetical protein
MRISDDRYSRERLSLDLALRFLRHEARTQTIRAWTGLTDDRIRNLYRSYMSRGGEFVPRHRGKSPHQIAYFMRSARLQWETAQLASLLTLLNVVPVQPGLEAANTLPAVSRGERLCCAFEIYSECRAGAARSGGSQYTPRCQPWREAVLCIRDLPDNSTLVADLIRTRRVSGRRNCAG